MNQSNIRNFESVFDLPRWVAIKKFMAVKLWQNHLDWFNGIIALAKTWTLVKSIHLNSTLYKIIKCHKNCVKVTLNSFHIDFELLRFGRVQEEKKLKTTVDQSRVFFCKMHNLQDLKWEEQNTRRLSEGRKRAKKSVKKWEMVGHYSQHNSFNGLWVQCTNINFYALVI